MPDAQRRKTKGEKKREPLLFVSSHWVESLGVGSHFRYTSEVAQSRGEDMPRLYKVSRWKREKEAEEGLGFRKADTAWWRLNSSA